ncbi:MAG TPA: hypothetical protein VFT22_22255 [Kofleriaceae bacterium]|nr:hypothetical protein [Kofleriaceae bacterium]
MKMTKGPTLITSTNLSLAWARLFTLSMTPGNDEIGQAIVYIKPTESGLEDGRIRSLLDHHLLEGADKRRQSCDTVAKTIFPHTLVRKGHSREDLYATYNKLLPQLMKTPANRDGTYFQRMISYLPSGSNVTPVNQLEKIIRDLIAQRTRRSGLELAIFDPTRDHTNEPYLSFPCLHQVALSFTDADTLTLTALYPLHYIYERAYGNYLGLLRLGQFIAAESGHRLVSVVCVAGVAKREVSKSAVMTLNESILSHVAGLGGFEAQYTTCTLSA